jgi:hypothetical protein
MTKNLGSNLHRVDRLIDANLNRLREGVRVVEDITRYLLDDAILASKLKTIRHSTKIENYQNLLKSRDSINDVLKPSTKSELKREDLESIIISNFKRAQEASRVLEECSKLISDLGNNANFKNIRYELYDLEKKVLDKTVDPLRAPLKTTIIHRMVEL